MSALELSGVVFDVDGVLFDTERMSHQSWIAVSSEMGHPQIGINYDEFIGNNWTDIKLKLRAMIGPDFDPQDFLDRCNRLTQERIEREGVPVKPGVRELLAFLKDRHIPAALATSTDLARTRRRMDLAGLTPYLSAMIAGDQVVHSKPDPEIYLLACQALGTPPERTLAVEDSPNGIRAAAAAGMPTVMVPDMIPPAPELDALLYRRCSSLLELRDHLSEIL